MTSVVRSASPGSETDVAALGGLRFRWRHDEGGESGDLESFLPAFASWWRERAGTHLAFVAEDDGRPVGMTWLGLVFRVPGPERFERLAGVIQSVYVRPECRGLGIGSALVAAAVATARERGLDYLMVHPSERSYPVYERAGFARTSGVLELGLTRPRRPG